MSTNPEHDLILSEHHLLGSETLALDQNLQTLLLMQIANSLGATQTKPVIPVPIPVPNEPEFGGKFGRSK